MLQISNMEDGKSDWNLNETHLIIPMIDGDVTNKERNKILSNALTLNSLESGDQTALTNTLEQSLVIGLDKNLFETPNYKNDLIIIQNSDLKLLSCNSDIKNPVTYTLSYVDQDKSEILWHTALSKDGICSSDKAILEVNYDELGKTEQQINLESIDRDIASQDTKTNGNTLAEETATEQKKESQFINYYSTAQNEATDVILPNLEASKFIESVQVVNNNCHHEPNIVNSTYKLGRNTEQNTLIKTEPVIKVNESVPIKLVDYVKLKTDKKIKDIKEENVDELLIVKGVSNILPEKSLPLKKKAKMKRTVVLFSSENQVSSLKQDSVAADHGGLKFSAERKTKKSLKTNNLQEEEDPFNSSPEKALNMGMKRNKAIKLKFNTKKQKAVQEPLLEEDIEPKKLTNNSSGEESATKINFCTFDKNKFSNIFDLVECLRKCRIINATVWQTLNSGLKEMNVDILKEMNAKVNETYSPDRTQYSPQLKAFALVLYFKQPAAFNHLLQVYKTGWPPLHVIKEWKRRMNSRQRPNFIRAERDAK